MQLLDPTVALDTRACIRAPLLDDLSGRTIGLLTNGKVNADTLLTETAALFRERNSCTVLDLFSKANASAPAPTDTLAEIAERCDFMITASGD
ncbi:MAG: hypothetical protein GKR94_31260 [Gammaproteobacteria bacterium]|nr:hypothetical protein [Gammaproteobacteria bacterium]